MAIEQLLDEFNDDQMLFRLEAGAYEEECLATMANRAPTTNEVVPAATTITTEARQEGSAPADTNPTPDQQPVTTTLPEPVPTYDTQRKAAATPHSAAKPSSPTPPSDQPEQPHAPEDILGILEED